MANAENLVIHTHLGLGDHFICCGLVRKIIFKNEYKNYYIACKRQNLESVKPLFNDIKNAPSSKLNEVVFSSVSNINANLTNNVSESDKNTVKRSLNANMIKSIPKVLTDMIVDPKINLLYQLSNKIVNGPLTPNSPPVGVPGGSATVTSPNVNANTSLVS